MFFFFKQKTAYEMRISDWSSDVCSSDLLQNPDDISFNSFSSQFKPNFGAGVYYNKRNYFLGFSVPFILNNKVAGSFQDFASEIREEIGRASCRERVCQYV